MHRVPRPAGAAAGDGLQPASDIWQAVTIARIRPMMVDRLTKCIYGSYFYEPPDHNPCGPIDPTDPTTITECSCFTINNLFRNEPGHGGAARLHGLGQRRPPRRPRVV